LFPLLLDPTNRLPLKLLKEIPKKELLNGEVNCLICVTGGDKAIAVLSELTSARRRTKQFRHSILRYVQMKRMPNLLCCLGIAKTTVHALTAQARSAIDAPLRSIPAPIMPPINGPRNELAPHSNQQPGGAERTRSAVTGDLEGDRVLDVDGVANRYRHGYGHGPWPVLLEV
jgi:hypothetical protein